MVLTENTDQFIIGDRVWVGGVKPGQIAYIGETQFAPGEWAGVVLDEPVGKNDGTVANIRYFQCEPKKGIFSRLTRLTKYPLNDGGAGEPAATKSAYDEIKKSNGSLAGSLTRKSPLPLDLTPTLNLKNTFSKSSSPDSSIHSTPSFTLGDRVIIKSSQGSKAGILKYIGTTEFAPGEWCGVELDDPLGKNDGSVNGVRYFECQPKFGLFAPLHKISKSPANKRLFQPCMVHSNRTSSLRKHGSKESLVSMSSAASTSASVKSINKKIGVKTPTSSTIKVTLQESLKKKDLQIEKLLKERDLERIEVTRAANQADEAERQLMCTKKEFENYKKNEELRLVEKDTLIFQIKTEKNDLLNQLDDEKKKFEDLQFRFEEEIIDKADIKSKLIQYEESNNLLQKTLADERKRVEFLEQDSNKLFETEEQMVLIKDELDTKKEELETIKNICSTLEQKHISLEAYLTAARAEIESLQAENHSLKEIALKDKNNLKDSLIATIQKLEESNDELKRKNELLEQSLKESSEKNCKLLDIENELKKKFQTTIEELSEKHNGELNSLKEELKKIEILKDLNDTAVKNYEEQKAKMNNALEKKNFELKQLKDELSKIKEEFEIKSKESNEQYQLREKDLISTVEKLEENKKQRILDFEKLKEDLKILENLLESEKNKFKSEHENNKILNEKILIMEENYKKIENDKSELELKNEDVKRKLLSIEKELDYANNQKAKLETDILTFINSSKDSSFMLNKLNEDLRSKEKEVDTLQKEILYKTSAFERAEQEMKLQLKKQEKALKLFENEREKNTLSHLNELKAFEDKIKASTNKAKEIEDEMKKKMEIMSTDAEKKIINLEELIKVEKEKNLEETNKYEGQIKQLVEVQKELDLKLHDITKEAENTKSILEKEIQELKAELVTMSETAKTAKANTLLVEKKWEDKIIKDAELQNIENDGLKTELKKTKEFLFQVQSDLQKVLNEKNKLNEDIINLEKIRTHVENSLNASQDEYSKLSINMSSIQNENEVLKETINQLRNEISSKEKDANDKAVLLTQFTAQMKLLEESQKEKFQENETKIQQLEKEILNLQQLLEKTEIHSFEKILSKDKQIENLEKEMKKFKEQSSQLELEKDKDIECANSFLSQIQKELNDSKCQSQKKSETIENLEKKINQLSKEINIEKESKENLKSKCLVFEKEIFDLNEKFKDQNKILAADKTLEGKIAEISNKLTGSEKRKKELCKNNKDEMEKEDLLTELKSTKTLLSQKELEIQDLYVEMKNAESNKKEDSILQSTKEQLNFFSSANYVPNEPDFEKGQIDFLNSVIVDMQKKNDALKARIEILEMGYSPEDVEEFNLHNITARIVAPRLFCDICDRFDLHDTDDCPTQAGDEPLPSSKTSKTRVLPPQRQYCDICEIFGHDTAVCDATETF